MPIRHRHSNNIGTVHISSDDQDSRTFTAHVSGKDGAADVTYHWKVLGSDHHWHALADASGGTVVLDADVAATKVRVVADWTDRAGHHEHQSAAMPVGTIHDSADPHQGTPVSDMHAPSPAPGLPVTPSQTADAAHVGDAGTGNDPGPVVSGASPATHVPDSGTTPPQSDLASPVAGAGDGTTSTPSADPAAPHKLDIGINLAGAEFGSATGQFGTDYTYPTSANIDYYADKGFDSVRLPFLWEHLQHDKNGPLDAAELSRIDAVVDHAAQRGMSVILDVHNYGYAFGAQIGSADVPNSAFADLWGKIADHYKGNPHVVFGLMNEPHDQTPQQWLDSSNAAIAAIRATGATQTINVAGTQWNGAWTWNSSGNADVIGNGIQDPLHNYRFEVHQYLDGDGSGTHAGVVSENVGVERLAAITQWAEQTHNKLWLGEFGVANDPQSLTAMDHMLGYMQQHAGVWDGGSYWAGGPWWGDYMFSAEPQNGHDKPQTEVLQHHA